MSDSQEHQELTLGQLLDASVRSTFQILNAPLPNDTPTQTLLHRTLSDLSLASKLISHLSLLSPNETVEDISTPDLRCLLVDALRGQLELLARCKGTEERKGWLSKAQIHLKAYLELVDQYEVVSKKEKEMWVLSAGDMGRRREVKILRYKKEKELEGKLSDLKTHASKLGSSYDESDDEHARSIYLSLITYHYIRSLSELDSVSLELELLSHAIPTTEASATTSSNSYNVNGKEDRDGKEKEQEDHTWRLDTPLQRSNDGRLLDSNGKILRPFVILPSKSASQTRLRLQSQVFQPSHNLPTMTIDEFLAQEVEMGNVLQGGGPSSSREVAESKEIERGEREEELDTNAGREKEERELMKKREEDEWKDSHRRGEGNRLGRS